MAIIDKLKQSHSRAGALALTAAVHLALLWGWNLSRQPTPPAGDEAREAIQWILLPQPTPAPPELPRQRTDKPTPPAPRATASHVTPPSPDTERLAAPPLSAAPAQEAPRLIDRLEQAKGELGKIDAAIRKERRGLISAPADSPELRMQRKMAQAADLAPNKWYQAPKVTEILDPGGYGRKRYKVAGALGTYCITVESNHAPDGLDTMKNGIKPKLTNCPEHEQAATRQEW